MTELFSALDFECMERALAEARLGAGRDEVPVGAVLLAPDGSVLADHNRTRERADPTAHAEILVIRQAAEKLGVSKSHVSKKITLLEQELNTSLLTRSTRHLKLTKEGHTIGTLILIEPTSNFFPTPNILSVNVVKINKRAEPIIEELSRVLKKVKSLESGFYRRGPR